MIWTRATTIIRRRVCDRLERIQRWQKEQARKDQTEQRGTEEKKLMNGRVAKETMEARREASAANLMKEKGRGKGKSETRYCKDCTELERIEVHCPCKWTNSMDEAEELASLEAPDDEGAWCWPNGTESPGGESDRIKTQHSTTLQKTTEKSRRLDQ